MTRRGFSLGKPFGDPIALPESLRQAGRATSLTCVMTIVNRNRVTG